MDHISGLLPDDKLSSIGENTFTFTDNKNGYPESDIFTVSSDGLTLNQEYVIGTESYDENYVYSSREVDILNFVSTHIAEALQRKNTEKHPPDFFAPYGNW